MGYHIQLTSSLSFIVFILIDQMDLKSTAQEIHHTGSSSGRYDQKVNNYEESPVLSLYHHPLHPDWKFTFHRVYQPSTIPLGNSSSSTAAVEAQRIKRKTAIAAMSIAPPPPPPLTSSLHLSPQSSNLKYKLDKGMMMMTKNLQKNLNEKEEEEDTNIKWSTILENEFIQSFERQKENLENLYWKEWNEESYNIPQQQHQQQQHHQQHHHHHHNRRRHWKRHHTHHYRHQDIR